MSLLPSASSRPSLRGWSLGLAFALSVGTSGCASWRDALFGFGDLENDPQALHESARADIEAGEGAETDLDRAAQGVRKLRRLQTLYPDYGRPEDLDFLMVRGRFAAEEHERAFALAKAYLEKYPLTRQVQLERLLYDKGRALLATPENGLPFRQSDEVGATILEFLSTSFPSSSEVVPDALRLLADWHYGRDEYGEALLSYARLVDTQLPNAWTDLARYRIPLCLLRASEASDRDSKALWFAKEANLARDDEDGLTLAARLLRDYLEGAAPGGEPPAFTALAQRSLLIAERMQGERERGMQLFYARVGNAPGRDLHRARAEAHEQQALRIEQSLAPGELFGPPAPTRGTGGVAPEAGS
ncbi:MAG: hypothetical protein JNM84_19085 [Planctomycetes bacterium]|nr:hypothetical protein [Planctomycetota bacterium]